MQTLTVSKRITLKNILFLTDFSEPSVTALPFAAMIARAYGAKVTALHALVPSVYTYMTPEMAASLLDAEADVAKTEMSRVEAGFMGIPRETMLERNIGVWPVLSKRLEEGDIDLIVMGTHGRTGLNKAMFGSSAEEVFRRANVPVLTIGPAVRTGSHNGGRFQCGLEHGGGVCRLARAGKSVPADSSARITCAEAREGQQNGRVVGNGSVAPGGKSAAGRRRIVVPARADGGARRAGSANSRGGGSLRRGLDRPWSSWNGHVGGNCDPSGTSDGV
jgi:nucleotide-binding universal stress UspA family protein